MDQLEQKVRDVVFWYAGGGPNILLFPVENAAKKFYAVIVIDFPDRKQSTDVVVAARIVGDKVLIETDKTDRSLLSKLIDAGISREQIIKAYAGERLPDPVQP